MKWATEIVFVLLLGGTAMAKAETAKVPSETKHPRLIYDNDGNEALRGLKPPYVESHLAQRVASLAGTQVDSIYYCTTAGFGTCSRRSNVWKPLVDKPKLYPNNALQALFDQGTDPLAITLAFGKKHGIEVFENIRMNDVHDKGSDPMGRWRFAQNDFKQRNPELLLGSPTRISKTGGWSAVNYAHEQVRNLLCQYVEEGCTNYDIDGVHLDFFRHPVFFPSTYQGMSATDDERAHMTGLLHRVRETTRRIGHQRQRPILLSIRVPDSIEYCHAIGLDLKRWLTEGLIDRLVTSGYFQLNEWNYTAELAHRFGVAAYPSLDESRVKDPSAQAARRTAMAYRGRTLNAWRSGVDGILIFNPFDVQAMKAGGKVVDLWNELGDPTRLESLERHYFGSIRGRTSANGGNLPYFDYQVVETLNPGITKKIDPGTSKDARLVIAENSRKTPKCHRELCLLFNERALLSVEINGVPLEGKWDDVRWIAAVSPDQLTPGVNEVKVTLATSTPKPLQWEDMKLIVKPIDSL